MFSIAKTWQSLRSGPDISSKSGEQAYGEGSDNFSESWRELSLQEEHNDGDNKAILLRVQWPGYLSGWQQYQQSLHIPACVPQTLRFSESKPIVDYSERTITYC